MRGRSSAGSRYMLDTTALYDALECERIAQHKTQADVAREIGCSPNIFRLLPQGKQTDAHHLVSILAWLAHGVIVPSGGDIATYTIERPVADDADGGAA